MKNLATHAIILLVLLAAIKSFAQSSQNPANTPAEAKMLIAEAPDVSQCFLSGSDATSMNLCLTDHGTISRWEASTAIGHIFGGEGYAVCSDFGVVHGFDAGNTEGGWGTPTVTQPKGVGKFPFIVTRQSTDGAIFLKQTFNLDTVQRLLTVKMDVKNTSAQALFFPVVTRYFDGDLDNIAGDDLYGTTIDSVAGRNSVVDPSTRIGHEVKLSLGSTLANSHVPIVESFAEWNPAGSGAQTARTCESQGTITANPSDQIGRLAVLLTATLKPGQTKSVTFQYRVF